MHAFKVTINFCHIIYTVIVMHFLLYFHTVECITLNLPKTLAKALFVHARYSHYPSIY